jgi:hypothetical protein
MLAVGEDAIALDAAGEIGGQDPAVIAEPREIVPEGPHLHEGQPGPLEGGLDQRIGRRDLPGGRVPDHDAGLDG